MKKWIWRLGGLSLIMLAGLIGACGGGGGSDSSDAATVQVAITDAAADDYEKLMIAIKEIRLVPADCEEEEACEMPLIASFDVPVAVDVLQLAYQQDILGEAEVPPGTYNQVRLLLAENSDPDNPVNFVEMVSGEIQALKTPSGHSSGLKILGQFTVQAGEFTTLVLDFDPNRAITTSWNLKPTGIRIVKTDDSLEQYGALAGIVQPDTAWPVARVSIYPAGGGDAIASGMVNTEDGSFRGFVPQGIYHVKVTANDYEAYDSGVPENLPAGPFEVAIGADTDMGTVELAEQATVAAVD